MHLIRLDIDRKNAAAQLQVGPLGGGLNAVFSPLPATSATVSRFIRNVLFRGQNANELDDAEGDGIDGSMQWVDASGHVRMISYAGGSALIPARYIHSPMHPSERALFEDDAARVRGVGNLFWEGDDDDGRWDDLRGDLLGMVFCSPLGSVSPEKLWWAASRLGVHQAARTQLDEGYQHLKEEERDLLDRLRHAESVDHDRAWWSIERDRLAAEIQHISQVNHTSATTPITKSAPIQALEERLTHIKLEIARLRSFHLDTASSDSSIKADPTRRNDHRMLNSFDTAFGTAHRPSDRVDATADRQNLANKIERLVAEQANVESQLRQAYASPTTSTNYGPLDDNQLRQQLAHAEEMLRRWDRRSLWHRRLSEVQSHLKTRSPYRRTANGSLIPKAEKILCELTSGAVRQLPAWAIEASYLQTDHSYQDMNFQSNNPQDYRDEYIERLAPTANSRQRKMVDLAIRLAIAQAASSRIGRIPMVLDNSIEGFRGEALEQVLHVLASASRDGWQIVLATRDEFIARRITAHGGTVCRAHEVLRYAQPRYMIDSENDLGVHPELDRAPVLSTPTSVHEYAPIQSGVDPQLGEVNRQLVSIANELEQSSWWYPQAAPTAPIAPRVTTIRGKKYFLTPDSLVTEMPGATREFARRVQAIGIHRVGDFLSANTDRVANVARVEHAYVSNLHSIASLMCHTPQLRPFDARVLVACGVTSPSLMRSIPPRELVDRVDDFLTTPEGDLVSRGATDFELTRIRNWIDQVRGVNSIAFKSPDEGTDRPREFRKSPRRVRLARDRDRTLRARRNREPQDDQSHYQPIASNTAPKPNPSTAGSQWRFYLEPHSPVVDAPSIGPRMADKLKAVRVESVGELVSADPSSVASSLGDKTVTHETVIQWQQQAMLVCRIPNLRGHDAQLLVATGMNTAEQVASADPNALYDSIVRIASSKVGQRMLRGSAAPDRAEVNRWIEWARNSRAVRAA